MRILITAILFCTWACHAFGQEQFLLPVKVGEKWGYINVQGELVITPVYDGVAQFSGNMAVMQSNNKRGVINRNGKVLIPASYKEVKVLSPGLIAVKNSSWSLMDTSGRQILPEKYQAISILSPSIVLFKENDLWGAASIISGKILPANYTAITTTSCSMLLLTKEQKSGLANMSLNVVYPPFADEIYLTEKCNAVIYRKGNSWGIADTSGHLSDNLFSSCQILTAEYISFKDSSSLSLYNTTQNEFISRKSFQEFMILESGFIIGVKKNKDLKEVYTLMNSKGMALLPEADFISDGREGLYLFRKNGLWGFANSKGNVLLKPTFEKIDAFIGKFAKVSENDKEGLINHAGKVVIPAKYESIQLIDETAKAYADGGMDLYTFNENGEVYEKIHYKNVRTLEIGSGSNWAFTPALIMPNRNRSQTSLTVGSRIPNLYLIQEQVRYGISTRMRSDIPDNFRYVTNLFGMKDSSRTIFKPEFWNLEISDFLHGSYARIIFEGGRHGLISKKGHKILDFPVKKNGRPAREKIAFIGNFPQGLARINIGGKLAKKGAAGESIFTTYNSLAVYGPIYCNGGKWGFINREGKMVIDANFDFVNDFKNQVAIVKKDGKYGLIDLTGKFIIPAIYDNIEYLPDTFEKLLKLTVYKPKQGIISSKGHIILPAAYDDVSNFNEGKAVVSRGNGYGFADETNNLIIPDTFAYALPFHEGLAPVKINNKWGYIDPGGKLAIKVQYDRAGLFHDGVAIVSVKNRTGVIDKNGNYIIEPKLTSASEFINGFAVARHKGRYGMINSKGKWIIPAKFNAISSFDKHNLCQIKKGKKYQLMNQAGKKVGSHNYEKIRPFNEGLSAVKRKKYWGFVDTLGREVIKPEYFQVGDFSEGLTRYGTAGKWGYIDKSNQKVIAPEFRFAGDFKEGFASFIDNGKICLINKSGEVVQKLNTRWIDPFNEGLALIKSDTGKIYLNMFGENPFEKAFSDAFPFEKGVARVKKYGKWGVINDAGILLAPYQYENISAFHEEKAIYSLSSFAGIADLTGKIIINTEYEQVRYLEPGLFCVEQSGLLYYMHPDGNWIWKP